MAKIQINYNEKQLGCAIILEAAKEYCDPSTRPQMKSKILKDLENNHLLNALTDDLGIITAQQLKSHPDDIAERLGIIKEDKKTEEMIC